MTSSLNTARLLTSIVSSSKPSNPTEQEYPLNIYRNRKIDLNRYSPDRTIYMLRFLNSVSIVRDCALRYLSQRIQHLDVTRIHIIIGDISSNSRIVNLYSLFLWLLLKLEATPGVCLWGDSAQALSQLAGADVGSSLVFNQINAFAASRHSYIPPKYLAL